MKKDVSKKAFSYLTKYNKQTCKCGHSVTFVPEREYIICSFCGRKIINKTRGRFIKEMYSRLNESKRP